jgi:hypothetical protein
MTSVLAAFGAESGLAGLGMVSGYPFVGGRRPRGLRIHPWRVVCQLVASDPAQARTAALFTQGLQTRGPLELDLGDRVGGISAGTWTTGTRR